ncbi:TerD family protein [Protofrankia symbiont of Coriaria myrtifolia]|uniref:TerD family protein n=1 Tax=Protofrankia symbiont of Coriaria myrtifolia TaxID=1306540 RepID=UPI0010417916|nr:TerD family protein [Protofrankia symbiont of Coriaria myrtifolia]
MTVILPRGGNVLLSDEAPGIERVGIGLGWSGGSGSAAVELDGFVVLDNGGATSSQVLLAHQVPNPTERVGASPPPRPLVGDVEKLVVTLAAVPAEVSHLQFGMAIYDAAGRGQTFRSVRHTYVRVLNHANNVEIARYSLDPGTGLETAMIFGEIYRHLRGWKFRAVGQGYVTGLPGLAGPGGGDIATAHPSRAAAFLTRASPARTRRNVAAHLHPPRTDPPRVPPVIVPSSPPRPPPPHAPPAERDPAVARLPTPPAGPAQPAGPAAPATPVPAATRSPLDLSGPDEAAPAAVARATATRAPARPSSTRINYGEHSSRHKQRMEHVTVLDDDHPATAWTEEKRGSGTMTVTLQWALLKTQTGLPRPSNIHLGCLWQANDAAAGLMQDLGDTVSAPGHAAPRQVLRLGRRDELEGQTIFVDLGALLTFRRFFVFAYGLHTAPEWSLLRPVLTVAARTGEQLTIRLGDAPPRARICVVASFHVAQDDVIIRRENDFLEGVQADVAVRHGWSLEWSPGGETLRDVP